MEQELELAQLLSYIERAKLDGEMPLSLHCFNRVNFQKIYPEILRLTQLQRLSLVGDLTDLPESIGELVNLGCLELSTSQPLTALPESIGQLRNLTNLSIHCKHLTVLPQSISNLTNLRCLSLLGSYFEVFPESVTHLTDLICLDVRGNPLKTLPKSITKLVNLKSFLVDGHLVGQVLSVMPEVMVEIPHDMSGVE